ncbi:MAG: 4Fe-4S dicluster domain-containing protein [Candidatus Bathyarchaeia archaeon]|nr:oxidoreductase [Candidatus Bathyarchaeota archaeon]
MSLYGLLIDYQWCSGCHSCEVACKQEHNLPVGVWGIKVYELVQEYNGKIFIDYFPFPTDLCNLCAHRTKEGKKPACVQHCMARCMYYGKIEELIKIANEKSKMVLWVPRQ